MANNREMVNDELIVRLVWHEHPFLKLSHHFDNDDFYAFVKNELQTTDYLIKQIGNMLEAFLGVMFLMKQNWHCDKISKKFMNAKAREECKTYSNYANIIYEHTFLVYAAGKDIVKPKFFWLNIYVQDVEMDITFNIRKALKKLSWISKIYFGEEQKQIENLENAINGKFKLVPKMEKEDEKAFNDVVEKVKEEKSYSKSEGHPFLKHFVDNDFIAFVENKWQTTADQTKKWAHYKEHNEKMLEAHCGVLYLMKQNWHCDQTSKKLKNDDDQAMMEECEKYSKYVKILYEYLFQLYAKERGLYVEKANIVKPKFSFNYYYDICDMMRILSWISKYFFDQKNEELSNLKSDYERMFGEKSFEKRPELVNEYAFNDVIDEAKMIDRIKLDNESFDKHFKALHDEFDKKLEQFAKNAIEMVANDEEMAEKEEIVKNIWQGHPFLIEEKLAKNGKRIANDNKEKMTVKKPKEENSKKGID